MMREFLSGPFGCFLCDEFTLALDGGRLSETDS